MEAESYWDKALKRRSPSTVESYRRYMTKFLEWSSLTMEELYNLQKKALASDDLRDSDEAVHLVGEYMDHMQSQGLSNSTQNMFLKAMNSFFEANKLPFNSKSLRKRRISNGVQRITKTDIHALYLYALGRGPALKARNKALYMFLKDSGLRVSDASNMDVEDYLGARIVEVGGVPFRVFKPFSTLKTGDLAHTILGPESTSHIDKMIGDRTSGPLFTDTQGRRWKGPAMTTHVMNSRRSALGNSIRVSAHSFRKFFVTTLEGAGLPGDWIRILQGKAQYVYSRPQDDDTLLNAYAAAYDNLRILPSSHLTTEVQNLRQRIAELEELDQERVDEMRNEVLTMINEMRLKMGLDPAPRPKDLPK